MGRGIGLAMLLAALITAPALAQEQPAATDEPTVAAKTIAKMFDPNTWVTMMTMGMDPRIWMNPISSCAACHDNADTARYQQVFGPFTGMMNPGMWMDPQAYNEMFNSVLDQKAAEEWARAVQEKYGLEPGDAVPTMHNWWFPTMPMPMPTPAPEQAPAQ